MSFPSHSLSPVELAGLVAAEREGSPFVAYKDGEGELRLERLGDSERITIGRGAHNDIVLEWDPEVSRAHAQLDLVDDDWTIVDDGLSRNGTFVNGERIVGRRRLRDGDAVPCSGRCRLP
jgi:hypothetical protein